MSKISIFKKIKRSKGKVSGGVEGVSHGVVFGMAVGHALEGIDLQFFLDGQFIGNVKPSIPRVDAAGEEQCCGFTFDLRPFATQFNGQKLEIRDKHTGSALSTTPIYLEPNSGWGMLDGVYGTEVRGWAVCADIDSKSAVVVTIDGEVAGEVLTEVERPDLRRAGVPRQDVGFCFQIPARWLDGESHIVHAHVKGSRPELRGGGQEFKCKIAGVIETLSSERIGGWIINLEAPSCGVGFDLWVNGQCVKKNVLPNISRPDVGQELLGIESNDLLIGFDVSLSKDESRRSSDTVFAKLCVPGSSDSLLSKEFFSLDKVGFIQYVEQFISSSHDREGGGLPSDFNSYLLRSEILSKIISPMRSSISNQLIVPKFISEEVNPSGITDVIIPVYKGYHETLDCIKSAVATIGDQPIEIIVINDCSPDGDLSSELRKLSTTEEFTLIENEKNLGFVATVNRGMKIHPDRDVLLLNSDTVVPEGWLSALRRAAYSSANIGTVTPFSNRATIFSLPRTCYDNEMPLGMTVDQLNQLCSKVNREVVVDVPTAVGFCMYIRRDALNEVGYFDEELWAKGYCEENDFCIRASGLGWRNVAACDVFVEHHGSVSFDTEKAPRVKENLARLNLIYPDYPSRVDRYIQADPMAIPRGRVNIELLKKISNSYVLFVTHNLGGGTEVAIRDLCKTHEEGGKKVLILRSSPSGKMLLAPAVAPHESKLISEYPKGTSIELISEHLQELNIEYVQFHHTINFPLSVWQLPEMLGVPFDVMIHDFYFVCPRINMIDDSGSYCGQPSIEACERCIIANGHQAGSQLDDIRVAGNVNGWRQFHLDHLRQSRELVTPSSNSYAHINKYLPLEELKPLPHPEREFVFKQKKWNGIKPYRVALLGAIGPHKGSGLLLDCARYALREALPLQFVVIGYTDQDDVFAEFDNVEITGKYRLSELDTIVDTSNCVAALFLSVWPETYCYTLSEAWRLGLYPVVLDIGAPAERVRESGVGEIVPFTRNPNEIVDGLLRVLGTLE